MVQSEAQKKAKAEYYAEWKEDPQYWKIWPGDRKNFIIIIKKSI